ncbi:hypothetical protein REA38_11650 [Serratia sp. MF2]|uniref:hypothetical protein n=1 Tax=Serratia sp. MF1(2023) TaxID=3059171 RepID=UPI0027EDD889|nr:hypothetical protein [Serratia sp. MF1(2023)]MDQ7104204.1 hypothetical protein [Serratia sp. MF1(2023)]
MSRFLDQVRRDISDVFLNQDEFGKIIKWNGNDLAVAEDATAIVETQYAIGSDLEMRRLVFGDNDLDRNPLPYEQVFIDGERWLVRDVRNPPGFLIVTLERNSG